MNTPVPISAEIRQLIVKQLGAALADAWRRQHEHDDEREDVDREVVGAGGAEDAADSV